MKILMVNVVCGIRSTGRICTDLAQILEKQGHTVKIAYGREHAPEEFKRYEMKIGQDFDVKLHGLKARMFDAAGFGSIHATKKFIKWIENYDPDIIHLHNIHGYYINIEVLFSYLKSCNKRIIWTLHDCWAFTGHTAYCDSIECTKWENGCGKCPLLKSYPKSYLDFSKKNWIKKKRLFSDIPNMTIVTPSKWLAKLVKKSFLKNYDVKTIENGIDTSVFSYRPSDFRKKHNLFEKFILLGVATSWDDMKGLSDFIKLAEMLDDQFKIVLVGLSKDQLSQISKNILGIQRTSNLQELVEIYSAADLFLNLSYCENYPTVNIEAMACGTPVLTYRTGGSPEIVEKNGGFIIDRGNIQEVYDKIVFLKNNELKRVCIQKMEYDKKEACEKYLELYKNIDVAKPKILFLTNVPSPYRVRFFNKLSDSFDLTVLYQKENSSERDKKWVENSTNEYTSVFLKGVSTGVDNAFCPSVIKYLKKKYDAIIICGNASPTEILAIEWCKMKGISYCIEGDGAFVSSEKKGLKDKIKKHLIKDSAICFSTCQQHDRYYEYYGALKNTIERYRFSSITIKDVAEKCLDSKQKERIRLELGIEEANVFITVGQFIYRKGFDILLKSFSKFQDDCGLYIVGGKPTEDYINIIEKYNIKNVHFIGFQNKEDLKKYYFASDVFVLPTREDIWGLVVNEAMSCGLPVVTTERCNAGLELIDNKINGFVVPVEDEEALYEAMNYSLNHSNLMGIKALETIRNYTIETMVEDHVTILNKHFRRKE